MSWPVISQQIMATDTLCVIAPVNEAAPTIYKLTKFFCGFIKFGCRPSNIFNDVDCLLSGKRKKKKERVHRQDKDKGQDGWLYIAVYRSPIHSLIFLAKFKL